MKIFLIFEDKELLIDSPCEISVKSLMKQLSSHTSINSEKLLIMNEKEVLDENFIINKDEAMKKFILIKSLEAAPNNFALVEDKFNLEDGCDMEELIMNVTGAKKKLSSKKGKLKNKPSSIEKKLEIMNQLFSRGSMPRSSHFLRQEFENLIAQSSNIRENLISEESIFNTESNTNNNNQVIFNPFVRNQNNLLLRTLRYNSDEGNNVGHNANNINVRQSIYNNLNNFIPQINPFRRMSVQPDLQLTKNLVDMGFSEDQAKRALSLTGNNLNAAADLILSNENLEELANPISYSQTVRVPNQHSANRFHGFNMMINNINNNNNNNQIETNSNLNTINNNTNSVNSVSASFNQNNVNIESNSNLTILNNLVINNNNLMNDDSNYSYQEELQNNAEDELMMEFDVNSENKNNEDI